MARPQTLFCCFLLVLIGSLQVQADTPCTRRCPEVCERRKSAPLDCLSTCVKQCEVDEHGGKWIPENRPKGTPAEEAAKQNKEVKFISKEDNPEVMPTERQNDGGSTAKAPESSPKLQKKMVKSKSNKKKKEATTEARL